MAYTLELVVRSLKVAIWDQNNFDLMARFELGNLRALFVQQIGCHFDRDLRPHSRRVLLHGFFLNHAKDVQCRGLGIADNPCAITARAGDVSTFVESRAQALA
jgi:hypothetical protein